MLMHSCVVYLNQGFHRLLLVTQNVGLGRGIAGAFEVLSLACRHSAVCYCEHDMLNQGCLSLVSLVVALVWVLGGSQ